MPPLNRSAEVHLGTLDDLDGLRSAAAASGGAIHLAFKHDIAFSGDFQGAADADRRAIETFGEALAGSDRPFVIASGLLGLTPGRVGAQPDAVKDVQDGTYKFWVKPPNADSVWVTAHAFESPAVVACCPRSDDSRANALEF